MKDADIPAFPTPRRDTDALRGMSLEEWYAGLAMQGILAAGQFVENNVAIKAPSDEAIAKKAFAIASAMMRAIPAQQQV